MKEGPEQRRKSSSRETCSEKMIDESTHIAVYQVLLCTEDTQANEV